MHPLGVVYYHLTVTTSTNSLWHVQKRYKQFETLHELLLQIYPARVPVGCELPPKHWKIWYGNTPQIIEERRILLQHYLKKLVAVRELASSAILFEFLTTDKIDGSASSTATAHFAAASSASSTASSASVASAPASSSSTKSGAVGFGAGPDPFSLPDDYEVTAISIPAIKMMSDHVLYQIDVENVKKRSSFCRWTVLKRFGQFAEMDAALRADLSTKHTVEWVTGRLPAAPPKYAKLIYDHQDDAFVDQRRVLLENYLQKLLWLPEVATHPVFLQFLGVKVTEDS
jgi:hypothetical protein